MTLYFKNGTLTGKATGTLTVISSTAATITNGKLSAAHGTGGQAGHSGCGHVLRHGQPERGHLQDHVQGHLQVGDTSPGTEVKQLVGSLAIARGSSGRVGCNSSSQGPTIIELGPLVMQLPAPTPGTAPPNSTDGRAAARPGCPAARFADAMSSRISVRAAPRAQRSGNLGYATQLLTGLVCSSTRHGTRGG